MKKKQLIIIVVAITVAIAGVYAWTEFNRKNKDLKDISPDYEVQAVDLINEFVKNDSDANRNISAGRIVRA